MSGLKLSVSAVTLEGANGTNMRISQVDEAVVFQLGNESFPVNFEDVEMFNETIAKLSGKATSKETQSKTK